MIPSPALPLPRALPEEVGFSSACLNKLTERLREGVEKREIPGAVALISRRGRVVYEACLGVREPATQAPMRADSIFRIASMTKPMTSMAAMMLVEDGLLALSDRLMVCAWSRARPWN